MRPEGQAVASAGADIVDGRADEKRMQPRRLGLLHVDGDQRDNRQGRRYYSHDDWRDPRDRDADRDLADRDAEE